jgi:small subunit ribosomal protein S5
MPKSEKSEKVGGKTSLGAKTSIKKKNLSRRDIETRRQRVLNKLSRRGKSRARGGRRKEEEELDVRVVSIRRVAKVKAGGKRLKLSVMVVVGDKGGKIGVGVAKGKDVHDASQKAVAKAKRIMIAVSLKGQTIPHEITQKFCAAKVFLKPAAPGTGVIAGGAVRAVVEAAGIKDILSKELGSKNIIPNVYATFEALKNLRLTRV